MSGTELTSLVFASRNAHKIRELNEMVAPLGLNVVTVESIAPDAPDVEETGSTFFENAALKAIAAYTVTNGRAAVADDSGICAHGLDNAPGIYSARWAGEDEANNDKLIAELAKVSDRSAHYHCALALVCPKHLLKTPLPLSGVYTEWPNLPENTVLIETSGQVHGTITHERQGTGGFGYDPLFFLPELNCTFAQVTPEVKHNISHRGRAFRDLVAFLDQYACG